MAVTHAPTRAKNGRAPHPKMRYGGAWLGTPGVASDSLDADNTV